MKHFQDATITTIANKPIVTFEDYDKSIKVENGVESTLTLPKSFVLKYVFDDGGWFGDDKLTTADGGTYYRYRPDAIYWENVTVN
jgi:hypothetical protein